MAGPIRDQSLRRFYSSAVCGKLAVSDVDDVREIWVGDDHTSFLFYGKILDKEIINYNP